MMFDSYRSFMVLGLVFISIGIILLLLPLIPRISTSLDRLEKLPWIFIYVYRSDNFYFVTSPILIIIALAFFSWKILKG